MSRPVARCAVLVVLVACGGAAAPAPDIDHSLVDTGQVCLSASVDPGAAGAGTFAEDAPVYVSFDAIGVCLSSSCTRDPLASNRQLPATDRATRRPRFVHDLPGAASLAPLQDRQPCGLAPGGP